MWKTDVCRKQHTSNLQRFAADPINNNNTNDVAMGNHSRQRSIEDRLIAIAGDNNSSEVNLGYTVQIMLMSMQ